MNVNQLGIINYFILMQLWAPTCTDYLLKRVTIFSWWQVVLFLLSGSTSIWFSLVSKAWTLSGRPLPRGAFPLRATVLHSHAQRAQGRRRRSHILLSLAQGHGRLLVDHTAQLLQKLLQVPGRVFLQCIGFQRVLSEKTYKTKTL